LRSRCFEDQAWQNHINIIMTGRSNRSRENVLAIDKPSTTNPSYVFSIPSGISVQELKNMTALRMAQQERWSKQNIMYSVPSPPTDLYFTYEYSQLKPEYLQQAEIMNSVESYSVSDAPGVLHSQGLSQEPRVCIPSGVSVQELKELTKLRLAREAHSPDGEATPPQVEQHLDCPCPVANNNSIIMDSYYDSSGSSSMSSSCYNSSRSSSYNDIASIPSKGDQSLAPSDQFRADNIPEQVSCVLMNLQIVTT